MTDARSGYLSDEYGSSLRVFGDVERLERSGAWLVRQPIVSPYSATLLHDGRLGYRRLMCSDWTGLADDLAGLTGLVSVFAATDALAPLDMSVLRDIFKDVVRPYKEHYVIEVNRRHRLPDSHRYRLRVAQRSIVAQVVGQPAHLTGEWMRLVGSLVARHGISGPEVSSDRLYACQLASPGAFAVIGLRETRCVAITVWFVMGTTAYYHLAASDAAGYASSATYLLVSTAIDHCRDLGVTHIDLGANAGTKASVDGLAAFKSGWATCRRQSFLCGRILDQNAYRGLSSRVGVSGGFFPAYRSPSPGQEAHTLTAGAE